MTKKVYAVIMGALVGVTAFLLIYGVKSLDVTNDAWILNGYDETDIVDRYCAWINFRNQPWTFPFGKIESIGVPIGVYVSQLDGMPLLCIFFKALNPLLPETFQFEGLYMLLVFVLQGIFSCMIFSIKKKGPGICLFGTIFLTFSPILIERGFRHSSLSSHFFILGAILLWLKYKRGENSYVKTLVSFLVLNILAVGITPYFSAMIMVFVFLCMLEKGCGLKNKLILLLSNIIILISFGYVFGLFAGNAEVSRWGYGYYGMNYNALINPYSIGEYTWSRIFTIRPILYGQYDGFNYLGAGVLFLIIFCMGFSIIFRKKVNLFGQIKNNKWLIICCGALILFAGTNVMCFDEKEFIISISEELQNLFGIFRASSRLFWPVYYLLIIYSIFFISDYVKRGEVLLGILLLVQLWDISGAIIQKHTYFNNIDKIEENDLLPFWGTTSAVYAISAYDVISAQYIGVYCGKMGAETNMVRANSGDYANTYLDYEKYAIGLDEGTIYNNIILLTYDGDRFLRWKEIYQNEDVEFFCWSCNGIESYLVAFN